MGRPPKAAKPKVIVENKIVNVPYCKAVLRNMLSDENGASFTYNGKHIAIIAGEEIELKKEIVEHLKNLVVRKSRFEHPAGSTTSVKTYYQEPRFLMQVMDEYDKEEEIKVRKVI